MWISVKDRLPKSGCLVRVKIKTCARVIAGESSHSQLGGWQCGYGAQITHWMPLPEPPKD